MWKVIAQTCGMPIKWGCRREIAKSRPHDRFHVMDNLSDVLTQAQCSIQKDADENIQEILKGYRLFLIQNKENLKA